MSNSNGWLSQISLKRTGTSATVNITRPSTTPTYSIGQVIGDTGGSAIFTFPGMINNSSGGEIMITSVELEIDVSSIPSGMSGYMLRLYNALPTAIADAGTWDLPSGDRGKYLGRIQLGIPIDEGSTLFIDNDNINKQITLISTSLYTELVTLGSYTATSAAAKRLTIHATEI